MRHPGGSRYASPRGVGLGVAIALVLVTAATAATKTLTFSDGECAYRVAFDPAKVDAAALKASFDYLAAPSPIPAVSPDLSSEAGFAAADPKTHATRCAAHHARLAAMRFIDAGVGAIRDRELAELDAVCQRVGAALAAARGDLAAARARAPACTRYADLLALPPEKLKTQWNDLVVDLCQTSTEVNVCAGHLQRSGEGQGSEMRRKIAVLQRWFECAGPHAQPVDIDGEKRAMRERLSKRFKAKALSCAQ